MRANYTQSDMERMLQEQVGFLEKEIAFSMKEHRVLRTEIGQIQKEIDIFYGEYQQRMDPLIKQLDCLRGHAAMPASVEEEHESESLIEDRLSAALQLEDARRRHAAEAKEAKKIYRQLAKKIHPDIAKDDPDSQEAFTLLQDSYATNDIETLFLLEQSMEDGLQKEDSFARIEKLEKRLDKMRNNNDELKWKKHQLLCSDLYHLKIRVLDAYLEGRDLLVEIEDELRREIAELMPVSTTANSSQVAA